MKRRNAPPTGSESPADSKAGPMRRRRFLESATGTLAVAMATGLARHASARTAETPAAPAGAGVARDASVLRFAVVADPQYADIAPAGTRFYRRSPAKLAEALAHFDTRPVAFGVNLGDLIDRDWASYDVMLDLFGKCRHRFHHVPGNHDFDVADAFKRRVPARLGWERGYGRFEVGAWCFVVLDTNDVSTYAHPEGSPEKAAAAAELRRITALGWRQAQAWNGGVGAAQLAWFEATCQEAAQAGRRVVVLAHHPLFPDDPHLVWNAATLQDVVRRHRHVVAWLNGHNHAGAFGIHAGVPCLTFRGMVETDATNAFAEVELRPDRMIVTGHGREPSRDIALRAG